MAEAGRGRRCARVDPASAPGGLAAVARAAGSRPTISRRAARSSSSSAAGAGSSICSRSRRSSAAASGAPTSSGSRSSRRSPARSPRCRRRRRSPSCATTRPRRAAAARRAAATARLGAVARAAARRRHRRSRERRRSRDRCRRAARVLRRRRAGRRRSSPRRGARGPGASCARGGGLLVAAAASPIAGGELAADRARGRARRRRARAAARRSRSIRRSRCASCPARCSSIDGYAEHPIDARLRRRARDAVVPAARRRRERRREAARVGDRPRAGASAICSAIRRRRIADDLAGPGRARGGRRDAPRDRDRLGGVVSDARCWRVASRPATCGSRARCGSSRATPATVAIARAQRQPDPARDDRGATPRGDRAVRRRHPARVGVLGGAVLLLVRRRRREARA